MTNEVLKQDSNQILSQETIQFIKKCYVHLNQARHGVWAFADLAEMVWNPKLQSKNKELYFSIIHDAIAYEIIKYEEILEMSELKDDFLAFYSKFVSKINTSHEYTNFLEDRITTLENRFGLVWKDQEEQLLKIVSEDEIILGVGKFLINKEYEFDGESKDKKKKFIKNKDGKQFILTRKRGDSFLYFCKELNQLFLLYSVQSKVNVYSFVENHFTKYYPILVKKGDNFGFGEVRDNLLIEGDNYFALQLLQFTHRGKIDVIYIDPPYNTGNGDFKYNDAYVGLDDGSRHSKWLSFMDKRLNLARELLSDDGVIFISIDEKEFAQLKLLCDKIFSEKNLINDIAIKVRNSAGVSGATGEQGFRSNKEYIFAYSKNKEKIKLKPLKEEVNLMSIIKEKKDAGKKYEYDSIMFSSGNKKFIKELKTDTSGIIKLYEHTDYEIKTINEVMKKENITEDQVYFKYYKNIFRTHDAQSSIRKLVSDNYIGQEKLISIEYYPVKGKNKDKLTELFYYGKGRELVNHLSNTSYIKNGEIFKQTPISDLWTDISFSSLSGEGGVIFKNGKKPINLLKRLLEWSNKDNGIVLDFFAGSGSTGHAVLELNKQDFGNRKFILCTNNENNICEDITYKRFINLQQKNFVFGIEYLQIKHISDLDLENADDIGNFEYVKQINNVKFNATKTIDENDYLYITDTYSVLKKSNKNKQKEYCDFFDQSIKENITNLVFVSSDRTEYDYFRKVISDYISTLKENPLFEKIKYYQMSKNYMDNMLSIINGEEELDVEKYMVDEENQENGEQ